MKAKERDYITFMQTKSRMSGHLHRFLIRSVRRKRWAGHPMRHPLFHMPIQK